MKLKCASEKYLVCCGRKDINIESNRNVVTKACLIV